MSLNDCGVRAVGLWISVTLWRTHANRARVVRCSLRTAVHGMWLVQGLWKECHDTHETEAGSSGPAGKPAMEGRAGEQESQGRAGTGSCDRRNGQPLSVHGVWSVCISCMSPQPGPSMLYAIETCVPQLKGPRLSLSLRTGSLTEAPPASCYIARARKVRHGHSPHMPGLTVKGPPPASTKSRAMIDVLYVRV